MEAIKSHGISNQSMNPNQTVKAKDDILIYRSRVTEVITRNF